jgi:hypothetical protein
LIEVFVAATDYAAPEIPRGNRFLVWEPSSILVPGDLLAYRHDGHTNLGWVVRNEREDYVVNRNWQPELVVRKVDILGKVICVYWQASLKTFRTGNS